MSRAEKSSPAASRYGTKSRRISLLLDDSAPHTQFPVRSVSDSLFNPAFNGRQVDVDAPVWRLVVVDASGPLATLDLSTDAMYRQPGELGWQLQGDGTGSHESQGLLFAHGLGGR